MARPKTPNTNKRKDETFVNKPAGAPPVQAEAARPEPLKANGAREASKLEVVKTDARASVVPINLENEIRRRAYELAQHRGFSSGHETEDWLAAESEILHRYRQQSA